MNSLRPLITITIIVLVGVFLYTKLNQEPPKLSAAVSEALQDSSAEIPPPLATSSPTTLTPVQPNATETPQWTPPVAEALPGAPTTGDNAGAPAVPAMPELPPLPSAAQFSDPAPPTAADAPAATVPPSISLPTDNSAPRYPSSTASPDATVTAPPVAPSPEAAPAASAVGAASADPTNSPVATSAPVTPAEPSFAASWAEVQSALSRQELAPAHQMLSRWYEHPTLTPAESQQVTALLGQLAGTVVYSTEHRLEPPYVVRQGDTLESIAAKYDVPWQLLAKINGIPAADLVRPGQELKVIHGPFSAVVNLTKNELTLMLNDRYAGRFAITSEPAAAVSEGQWVVDKKLVNPSTSTATVYAAAPSPVEHVLVLKSSSQMVGGATISIASASTSPSGPAATAPTAVRLSSGDAEEVADILSVGSRVTIRK